MERSPRRRWSGSLLWVWQSERTDAGRRQASWAGTGIKPVMHRVDLAVSTFTV
jgi:hypothetical protein